MLEQSLRELQTTVDELEKRADGLGEESRTNTSILSTLLLVNKMEMK